MEDGGYYAIKGFAFQFDKAINEILGSDDEYRKIAIENIQDINSDDFIMQVKHKETQKYKPLSIREPILQLVEKFIANPNSKYILYCHFKDETPRKTKLTKYELGLILKNIDSSSRPAKQLNKRLDNVSDSDKDRFLTNFELIFAPSYDDQFEVALGQLARLFPNASETELTSYYSQIIYYLQRLVISNVIPEKRTCTKQDIMSELNNTRSLVFTSAFLDYKGYKKYEKFVRDSCVRPKRNNQNTFFIGEIFESPGFDTATLVVEMIEKYFVQAKIDIKPPLVVIPENLERAVKTALLDANIIYNDGFRNIAFNEKYFFSDPVINKKMVGKKASESLDRISFKVRLLNDTDTACLEHFTTDMTYYFDRDFQDQSNSGNHMLINGLHSKDILNLI